MMGFESNSCLFICYILDARSIVTHFCFSANYACGFNRTTMNRLTLTKADKMWPRVIWRKTQIVVYYLGDSVDDNKVYFTDGIDFEEFLLHLDKGGSIFVTTLPISEISNESNKFQEQEPTPLLNDLL